MISYTPFYKTLLKKKITKYKLINTYLISPATLHRMKNNQSITLATVDELCKILNCDITDIVRIIN